MTRRKLPIGIQTLSKIREADYYYVDKTALAVDLVENGSSYFLSRPRRFGKSLFLDTLKELFEGNKPLFKGLAAYERWDWDKQYPVIRFSFGSANYQNIHSLHDTLDTQLSHLEQTFGITPQFNHPGGRFADLLVQLHKQTGQPVVVLVDEYDKPILDALDKPDIATANRDFLRGFYGTIKDYDAHIRFSFLTGVSKFSKVSLFSGLNNLYDLTLEAEYSAICGYTDNDIDTVFAAELEGLNREEIRSWYNGYNWLGDAVYNPFDILQLFRNRQYRNYWFETGTPTFLVKHLANNHFFTPDLAALESDLSLLSAFDVNHISNEALLFQTGYLTIHDVQQPILGQWVYTLGYPNHEVKSSLNASLLTAYGCEGSAAFKNRMRLLKLLQTRQTDELKTLFHAFFASIPHHWYTNNTMQNYEGYYASIFYSYFAALGLDITVEDCTNHGRLDMTVQFDQQVYLFEFKVIESTQEGKALQQLKDKGYADKYRHLQQPIQLIGVEFSKETRNVAGFEFEMA